MLAIWLPAEVETRLATLAKKTGRTKTILDARRGPAVSSILFDDPATVIEFQRALEAFSFV